MMKIFKSLFIVVAVAAVAGGATYSYFSDTVAVAGNTFSAGELDLQVDGADTGTAKFAVNNMKPDSQPTGSWTLANVGSVGGFLNLQNISVTNNENGCINPESQAGDNTCGTPGAGLGELQNVVNLRLYVDRDKDGYWSTGDYMIYNGPTGALASSYNLNESIPADSNVRINAVFDWWASANDNKAMGDDMTVNLTYKLDQKAI